MFFFNEKKATVKMTKIFQFSPVKNKVPVNNTKNGHESGRKKYFLSLKKFYANHVCENHSSAREK